jgi:hypothetical protein
MLKTRKRLEVRLLHEKIRCFMIQMFLQLIVFFYINNFAKVINLKHIWWFLRIGHLKFCYQLELLFLKFWKLRRLSKYSNFKVCNPLSPWCCLLGYKRKFHNIQCFDYLSKHEYKHPRNQHNIEHKFPVCLN